MVELSLGWLGWLGNHLYQYQVLLPSDPFRGCSFRDLFRGEMWISKSKGHLEEAGKARLVR